MKPRNALLLLFIIIALILCPPIISQAKQAKQLTKTKVIKYTPQIPSAQREGSCWTTSNIVRRSGVWRCMIGNEIFDPCYTAQDKKTIICGSYPNIKEPSGFVLKLTEPLPKEAVTEAPSSSAAMIELEDGTICDPISGASGATDGERIERVTYSCRIKSKDVVVFGDLQPGDIWIAETGTLVEKKTRDDLPPLFVKDLQKLRIKTVWR